MGTRTMERMNIPVWEWSETLELIAHKYPHRYKDFAYSIRKNQWEGSVVSSLERYMRARNSVSWACFETVGNCFRPVSAESAWIKHGCFAGGLRRPAARDRRYCRFHVEQCPRHGDRQVLEEQSAAEGFRQAFYHILFRLASMRLFETKVAV